MGSRPGGGTYSRGPENVERAQEIARRYSQGIKLDEIAKSFAISRERVRQIIQQLGMSRRPTKLEIRNALYPPANWLGTLRRDQISPVFVATYLRLEDGVLFYNERADFHFTGYHARAGWNARNAGKPVATRLTKNGYLVASILGHIFYCHRIIWALHTGSWPQNDIDHINGNRADNRIENLRDVSRSVNLRNSNKSVLNTSGFTGVRWHRQNRKWQASITVNGKTHYLGCFVSKGDAVAARLKAQAQFGFSIRHGMERPVPNISHFNSKIRSI